MGRELRELLERLTAKLGKDIVSEAELSSSFLHDVVLPYLRGKVGFIADAKLERRIRRGRYDARIGGLIFEFERPLRGIGKGIKQAKGYVSEFRAKGERVRCFVTDGCMAALINEDGETVREGELMDMVNTLQEQLHVLALMPVEPDDLLRVLSPESEICRSHVKTLLEVFEESKDIPFVSECFDLWKRVYGAAANLTQDVVKAVKKYAKDQGIELKTRAQVEEFLFVVETYLSIFMKMLVAAVAVKRGLVPFSELMELLSPPLEAFEKLADRVPFLKGAFEHDAFSWFVDVAKRDRRAARRVEEILGGIALTIDKIELERVRVDLLRRAYQRFFDPATRRALGEFYTNERIVNQVLDAVDYRGEHVLDKVLLDPACGSGTFLIVAIGRFIEAGKRKGLTNVELLERITKQIIGIDIHPFAVAMARVNYLLAVSELIDPSVRRVLGELKIPIYWTDSLASFSRRSEPTGLPVVEVDVAPLGRFLLPEPEAIGWDPLFDAVRRAVDGRWSEERFLQEFSPDLRLKYEHTLASLLRMFKERAEEGRDSRWLSTLRNVAIVDLLKGRCDFVVGNPPWVRIHNVDEQLRRRIGDRFEFYGRGAGWNPSLRKTKVPFREQVDYSMAFVEAGLGYLKEGGRLGFVITSNVVRSLYGGKMRSKLLNETTLLSIIDYSLSRVQLFEGAQNAPLIFALEKRRPTEGHRVKVEMVNRLEERLSWEIEQEELPLYRGDPASPWLMAPPKVVLAMRKMQKAGPRLGDAFSVNMGIKTAANNIFFVRRFEAIDVPNVFLVTTEGGEKVRIEKELLRPLVRGKDVDAWRYRVEDYIIWTHDDAEGRVRERLPPYADEYFQDENVRRRLLRRDDYRRGQPPWIIFRVTQDKLRDKVAWQDIEKTIKAVYLPSEVIDKVLGRKKLIVDSTVYFIAVEDRKLAYALTALLNSTPVRTYAATYAMRTGAVYCHYKGWYMGVIPIPASMHALEYEGLIQLSRRLHEVAGEDAEALSRLDRVVARLYGLSNEELEIMREFLEFFVAG